MSHILLNHETGRNHESEFALNAEQSYPEHLNTSSKNNSSLSLHRELCSSEMHTSALVNGVEYHTRLRHVASPLCSARFNLRQLMNGYSLLEILHECLQHPHTKAPRPCRSIKLACTLCTLSCLAGPPLPRRTCNSFLRDPAGPSSSSAEG